MKRLAPACVMLFLLSWMAAAIAVKPARQVGGGQTGQPQIQKLETQVTASIPPRLMWFGLDGGAAFTLDRFVTLNFRAMGGPTQYRWRTGSSWCEWRPLLPGQFPSCRLAADACAQQVFLQVRNGYGESNVLGDTIAYRFPRTVTLMASEASDLCRGHGWNFAVTKKDCNQCAYLLPYPLDGVIACEINSLRAGADPVPQGHKCEFELFGGRKLNEGWEFVSYEWVAPQGIGAGGENGCAILQQPAPGARDITLRVRLWHDIFRYADGIEFTLRRITLKGPCDQPPAEAFQ